MKGLWQCVAIATGGIVLITVLPLSPALAPADTRPVRLIVAALTIAAATACGLSKTSRSRLWTAITGTSAVGAVALLFGHVDVAATCVATYDGHPVLIGREYTAAAADYVRKNPGLAASDLLLDAGGVADRIWTSSSISSCRFWTGWAEFLVVPLVVTGLCSLITRRGYRVSATTVAPPGRAPVGQAQPAVYDAFISYRHTDADRIRAEEILEALETRRIRVAIDFRDFAPNEHFLSEMERCVKTSRFVLCVITARYLDSDHTSEEALISKTFDMADRKKRLVPLIFETVELPIWLHGLVGIDFTSAARVDPVERLIELVKQRTGAKAADGSAY